MNESQAIAVRTVTPDAWNMINTVAPVAHQSRLFGVSSQQQAAAVMLYGYERGLSLTASFELISIIQGKPSLSPRGALALIHQSGLLDKMSVDEQPGSCTVYMRRKNGMEYRTTFTLQDAERAGLIKKAGTAKSDGSGNRESGNWEKWPANMCRWRAIGFVADVLFADVLGGLRRADEYGADVDGEGNVVIEGQWAEQPVAPTPTEPLPVESTVVGARAITLEDLLSTYGADAIMTAANGQIPSTQDEVDATAKILAGSNA